MRILILRGGALGDFLVTLPALGLLRSNWPAAQIDLVGNARAAGLAVQCGYLDAAHSQHEARWSALFASGPLPAALTAWLGTFDLVLNYWPDPDRALAGRFPVRAGQTYLAGTAMPERAPAARHFCEPLRALGLATDDFRNRLPYPIYHYSSETREAPPAPREAPVAIHPGSGSAAKNWPDGQWRELMARLEAPVLLVLGEAERERWTERLVAQCASRRRHRLEVADRLPLPALAAALRQCRFFLGHDSGVSHLAAAVGLPCVLLFGPTDPAMWAPPGPLVRVIRRGPALDSISVQDVLAACRTSSSALPVANGGRLLLRNLPAFAQTATALPLNPDGPRQSLAETGRAKPNRFLRHELDDPDDG
jgi:heptosyltransferase-2